MPCLQLKAIASGRMRPLVSARRPIVRVAFQRKCRAELVLVSLLAAILVRHARNGIGQCSVGNLVEVLGELVAVGTPAGVLSAHGTRNGRNHGSTAVLSAIGAGVGRIWHRFASHENVTVCVSMSCPVDFSAVDVLPPRRQLSRMRVAQESCGEKWGRELCAFLICPGWRSFRMRS